MAPLAPQGRIQLAPHIVPQEEGKPGSATPAMQAGERIKPTAGTPVPGASRMTR